ncbi:MAG: hypothetical protein JW862_11355 [Anaerolineales bacterium]|nr:hypothetical protein [Anaerolineales bacterium]
MKSSIPTLRFDPPRSGWLGITVSSGKQKILVNTSSVFDPFPDFLKWLEKLAASELPCAWRINEEDSFMLFIVQPAEGGKGRLVLRGTRERDGAPDDTQDIVEFINTPVDPQELARSFSQAFWRYLKKGFISAEWGDDLRRMDFSRLEELLDR